MSDFTHALAVTITGLVLSLSGMLMGTHCLRSLKSGVMQVSPAIVLARARQSGCFWFMLVFFAVIGIVLLGSGGFMVLAGLRALTLPV